MTKDQVLKAIKDARKDFAGQHWGQDDETAVLAFIKILDTHVKNVTNDTGIPTGRQNQ